jgi:hypothetical protein
VITTHTLGIFAPESPNQAPNHESLDSNEWSVLRSGFFTFGERTWYLVSLTVDTNGKQMRV